MSAHDLIVVKDITHTHTHTCPKKETKACLQVDGVPDGHGVDVELPGLDERSGNKHGLGRVGYHDPVSLRILAPSQSRLATKRPRVCARNMIFSF